MKCEAIADLLVAYLEGEVTSEERGRVDAHLSVCQHCRKELAAMSSIQARASSSPQRRGGGCVVFALRLAETPDTP